MTSINTNQSAMVALDTLRNINTKLNTLNDQISTGKRINNAKDNAAIWSIAKTMDSDVMSFKAVGDSLSLAESTIGVARTASESITDLLIQVKERITQSSNKSGSDRAKITTDIADLRNQIQDIVESAQFNGVNLLNATESVSYLSSFNRDNNGGVTSDTISVNRQDLRVGTGGTLTVTAGDATAPSATAVVGVTVANGAATSTGTSTGNPVTFDAISISSLNELAEGDNIVINLGSTAVDYTVTSADMAAANVGASVVNNVIAAAGSAPTNVTYTRVTDGGSEILRVTASTTVVDGDASSTPSGISGVTFTGATVNTSSTASANVLSIATSNAVSEGDDFTIDLGAGNTVTYTASAGDTAADVIDGIIAAAGGASGVTNALLTRTTGGSGEAQLTITATAASDVVVANGAADNSVVTNGTLTVSNAATGAGSRAYTGVTGGGGLENLFNLFVSTETETQAALTSIENLITTSKDAASALGSSQRRIEIQSEFTLKLVDSLKVGISTLTDVDLSAASAELTALQVQQQLGLQSLSIANQAPQTILALFR